VARANIVEVVFTGDTSGFTKAAATVETKTESFGSKMKSTFGAITAGAAAFGAVKFFQGAIDGASDLNESLSKVNVVFGDSGKEIDAWSKNAAKSMGISRRAALESAGTFGNLFGALGFTQEASAGMSKQIVHLASDLASFNNANPQDVLLALRSGLLGEAEPLRKFGVSLSEARIQAEALATGLVRPVKSAAAIDLATKKYEDSQKAANKAIKQFGEDNIKAQPAILEMQKAHKQLETALAGEKVELTAAQKAQAAYSIILKDTATAHGDFSRTSDGLANRQRILKAEFDDMQSKVGQKLLPVITDLEGKLVGLVDWFTKLSPGVQTAIGILGGLVLTVFLVTKATQAWTAVQGALNVVMSLNPIGLVIIAIAALVAGIVIAYNKSETFRNIVQGAFHAVGEAAGFMKDLVVNSVQFVVDKFLAAVEWIVKAAARAFGWVPGIGDDLRRAAKQVEQFRDNVNLALDGIHTEKNIRITADANVSLATVRGARAAGGPVMAGGAYLVGEQGPELFVPSRSGTIVPNGARPLQVSVVINGQGADAGIEAGQKIVEAIRRYENRNGTGWRN